VRALYSFAKPMMLDPVAAEGRAPPVGPVGFAAIESQLDHGYTFLGRPQQAADLGNRTPCWELEPKLLGEDCGSPHRSGGVVVTAENRGATGAPSAGRAAAVNPTFALVDLARTPRFHWVSLPKIESGALSCCVRGELSITSPWKSLKAQRVTRS